MALWSIVAYVLVLTVLENVTSNKEEQALMKTLDDVRKGRNHIALFNEMLKTSQDTLENSGDDPVDIGTDLTRLKGIANRRRSSHMSSPVKNRRVRSQALRREKLNSQSLRSHLEHSRHSELRTSS